MGPRRRAPRSHEPNLINIANYVYMCAEHPTLLMFCFEVEYIISSCLHLDLDRFEGVLCLLITYQPDKRWELKGSIPNLTHFVQYYSEVDFFVRLQSVFLVLGSSKNGKTPCSQLAGAVISRRMPPHLINGKRSFCPPGTSLLKQSS